MGQVAENGVTEQRKGPQWTIPLDQGLVCSGTLLVATPSGPLVRFTVVLFPLFPGAVIHEPALRY